MSDSKPMEYPLLDLLKSKRVILASTSPRRFEILTQLGLRNIEVVAPSFEENLNKSDYTPEEYVLHTAIGKGRSVQQAINVSPTEQETVIVSSDTIIELDGSIYEKPKDKETQFKNLQKFRDSATPLVVMTGVVIITPSSDLSKEENDVQLHSHVEKTKLYFDKTLSDELIQSYVDSEDGLKVAAGFKIQSTGALLIDGIEGDYYNVVGLPLRATFKLLETAVVSKSYNT